MHVQFTAPARYVRASHDIVRHPCLRGTAKTLLLWALSLPPGSIDTVLTIGRRMPEGRTAVSRARTQLIEEGYLHVRRKQHPTKGTWSSDVMVTSVPLTDPAEIAAAWQGAAPADRTAAGDPAAAAGKTARRNPALGAQGSQRLGTSPTTKTRANTSPPAAPAASDDPPDEATGRAARLIFELAERDPRLRLGVREALGLAPLAAEWLARDARPHRLRHTLLADLPDPVRSPQGLLRNRLQRTMPPEPAAAPGQQTPPEPRPATPAALPDEAALERNRRGVARARDLLRATRRTCPTGAG
ncbi:hypothetical protein [Kitasatospora sp. KL5]|uniref:hypothetical protein n=1 Tax=Kitasatospora sp. KL5 TaxID=3425125 RepID=UPI003D6F984B